MSVLLADIDATCASLGYNDGVKYQAERDAQQGLKHLIWILRRDNENHEHRRHLGKSSVLRTDLVPMLYDCTENDEFTDVLIRLLVILTNPTLLLYRDGAPKDNQGRKFFMELIEILQRYKEAFTSLQFWIALKDRLHKVMEVDWALRSEEQGLLCERILVLIRNVLQVPGNPDAECRADNDASLHDQVIWSLHQSGIFDLVLYVIGSPDENQYHLHALEILCLMFREQSAESLADATLQRSTVEKNRDEQELIKARRREKEKLNARLPTMRHSRFGGTYVIQNFKSISDKDMIFHSPLQRAVALDLDFEKPKQKKSHRLINEEQPLERRSAFSVRLCLREYCLEVLKSAYNTLVRQVRRVLERNSGSTNHDDSYLLWAIRFFMEFNRLSGLQLQFVSESLSVQCFHWVLTRIQHDMDMMTSDKKQSRLWAKRMHVAVQTFRELLLSLIALQNLKDDKALALFNMLLNNVCYVLEYRETILHLLMNYNEAHSTRAFLRDIVETANIFIKMMEKFCKGSVVVQDKRRGAKRKGNKKSKKSTTTKNREEDNIHLEDKWIELASELSSLLSNEINLPEEDHPIPFDAASDKNIDDQKDDCMMRVYTLLRQDKLDQAVLLLRAAREVWPDNDCFGAFTAAPEDELLLLREIYLSDLGSVESTNKDTEGNDEETENNDHERDDDDDEDEEEEPNVVEKDLSFEDFAKRLVNPKIIRSCTLVLSDWEKIPTKSLKSAVTIMHRIAYSCSCPAMLYQAVLFRIFQQVLNTPRDSHHEELRRLGIYVIRKFIEMAPKNPKIYAELLFYKSIREANELEMGYCDAYETGTKGSWSEEQEDELRILFIENQNNPQSDQDVIDWILDNLIDKTRTRRGVLKKLKELGLLFKAPTKKSTAASNKNLWQTEEDEELKSLYDEHRAEDDCLQRIVNAFGERRSKNLIIKRLIQLHIIADKSEILPSKSRKGKPKKTSAKDGNNESDEENEENDNNVVGRSSGSQHKKPSSKQKKNKTKTKTRKIVKTPLDVATVRSLLEKLNEELQEAVEWLKESLNEAADDIVEDIEEDDGVPLLPLTAIQRDAMEDNAFQSVLIALGIQPPIVEMENYWRIPVYLTSTDLQLRAKVVAGEEVNVENNEDCDDDKEASDVEDSDSTNIDSDESEVDYLDAQINKRRENLNNLVFNKSDDEDEIRAPIKKLKKKRALSGNSETDEDSSVSQKPNKTKSEKIKKPAGGNKFSMENMKLDASQNGEDVDTEDILNFDSENLRQRLAELSDSDGSDEENNVTIINRTRIRKNVIASDSSDDEIENIDTDMNAGGSSQSAPTKINGTLNSSTVIYNNDENSDAYTTTMTSKTGKKRARSDDNDNQDTVTITNVNNSSDEEELFIKRKKSTATNATDEDKPKRRRTAIIIDDDDDDADNDNDDDIQF